MSNTQTVQAVQTPVAPSQFTFTTRSMRQWVNGKTLGFCQLVINGAITVSGFKIMQGDKGIFASPPSHADKTNKSKWHKDVYFSNKSDYELAMNTIVAEYQRLFPTA